MNDPDRAVFCPVCNHTYPMAGAPDFDALGWEACNDMYYGNVYLSIPPGEVGILPGPMWVCPACVKGREDFRKKYAK